MAKEYPVNEQVWLENLTPLEDRRLEEIETFREAWNCLSSTARRGLAESIGSSVMTLSQIANGHRNAGITLLERLKAVDHRFQPSVVRPELFEE